MILEEMARSSGLYCQICHIVMSILYRVWYVTTFAVYVTACDLGKFLNSDTTVKITGYVSLWILMWKYRIASVCYISRGIGVRNVSNSKRDLQGLSRSLLLAPFERPILLDFHCNSVELSCTVFDIIPLIYQNFQRSRDPEYTLFGGGVM